MWIFFCFVACLSFKPIDCGGTVEVRLLNYDYLDSGNTSSLCCDVNKDPGCDACDPSFEISLAELKGSTLSTFNTSQTIQYNNTNHIDFISTTGSTGRPFIFDFVQFSSNYYLTFKVLDNSIRVLDDVRFNVGQGEPSSFNKQTNYTVRTEQGNHTEIKFEYIIKCKTYYYGYCQVYCKPVPKQYACDNNGRRVCEPGWSGPNCTDHKTSPACKNTTCKNGATCIEIATNTTSCFCAPMFTGTSCEQDITSTMTSSLPTTQGVTTKSPTSVNVISTDTSQLNKPPSTSSTPLNIGSAVTTGLNKALSTSKPNGSSSIQTYRPSSGLLMRTLAPVTLNQITVELNTVKPDTSSDLTGVIVGSVLGALLLLILATVAVFLLKKKNKRGRKVNTTKESPIDTEKIAPDT